MQDHSLVDHPTMSVVHRVSKMDQQIPSVKIFDSQGFTVVELLMVMVVVGVISAYVIMRGFSSADVTLPSQAQRMAADLRHVQTLASTWGVSLVVSASGHAYSVSCKTGDAAPACSNSPVVDPATGEPFRVDLQKSQSGVTFVSPTTGSLTFDSLGKPNTAATYTLSSGSSTNAVSVSAITGKVTP